MKRIDALLVEFGFFESRNKAQASIDEGLVLINDKKVSKSNQQFLTATFHEQKVEILKGQANKYVSRGGIKLEGALEKTKCVTVDKVVLDVGISTGGFTDCLLKSGVKFVVGVDVGTHQLHDSLKSAYNLKVFENTNIKDLDKSFLAGHKLPPEFDIIVGDVSFISSTLIFPKLKELLKPNGKLLFLIKPQFELDSSKLSKNGIVKDANHFIAVEERIKNKMIELGFKVLDYFESPISGTDGNKEFFVYASR